MIDESEVRYRADALTGVHQYDKAIDLLEAGLADHPRSAVLLAQLAGVLAKSGRTTEATETARDALAIEPNLVNAKMVLMRSAFERKEMDEVVDLADSVIEIDPELPQAHIWLALALAFDEPIDEKVKAEARASYRIALAQDEQAGYYYSAVAIERRFSDPVLAERYLEEGLALHPNARDLLRLKADSSTTTSESRVAILNGLLAIDPTDREAHADIDDLFLRNRRRQSRLPWITVVGVLLVATVTDGWWTVAGAALVWGVTGALWRRAAYARRRLPAGYLRSRERRRKSTSPTKIAGWVGMALSGIGTILLIIDQPSGTTLMLAGLILGMVEPMAADVDDHRVAVANDWTVEAISSRYSRYLLQRLRRSTRTVLGFAVLVIVSSLFGAQAVSLALGAIAMFCAVEGIFFIRLIPLDRPSQVWFGARLAIFSALVLTAMVFVIDAAVAIPTWTPPEVGETVVEEQQSPLFPGPPPAPSDFDLPVPSIDFPVPSFDVPVPPADPAPGG